MFHVNKYARTFSQNYLDSLSILAQLKVECCQYTDFLMLPGDNADDGFPEQYALVVMVQKLVSSPVYVIIGDHDMASGSLDVFYSMSAAKPLPMAVAVSGVRCLFLDMSGGETVVLFTHTYPADCVDTRETTLRLSLWKNGQSGMLPASSIRTLQSV